ncbi:MAG: DinB family protein [Bacteroidota bacterium]
MSISQSLLPEFDHEMASTRKTLERIPDEKLAWKPHEKSFTMGALATHLATLPSWTGVTLQTDRLDISQPFDRPSPTSRKEILAIFDKQVGEARAALAAADDRALAAPWTLANGAETVFTMPKVAVLRTFVMNHLIHHRAQLGVYLRLNNIPVPAIYGQSADEQGM